MGGYLINFSVYTMAMIGVIFAAVFVFNKFSGSCFSKKTSLLNIEDSMKLSTRKTLHVVNVAGEKFLIAADIDRTSLISKLGDKKEETKTQEIIQEVKTKREDKSTKLSSFDGIDSLREFTSVIDFNKEKAKKAPVMRELAKKLKCES